MSDETPFDAPNDRGAAAPPAPRRVLGRLWTRQRQGVTLICVIVAAPVGEELRVMQGDDLYRSDRCADRAETLKRSETMRLQLEARGWR